MAIKAGIEGRGSLRKQGALGHGLGLNLCNHA